MSTILEPTVTSALPPSSTHLAAQAEIRCHAPHRVLLVALDIGKDVHVLTLRTAAGTVLLPPTELDTLASGFASLTALLDQHLASGAFDLVLLGHEPTGVYHEAWSAALLDRYREHLTDHALPPIRYRLLTPTLVKQERQRSTHRRRKTDAIDVAAIARLLADGAGNPVPLLDAPALQLRLTLGHLRCLAKQQFHLATDLLRALDRLIPGALGDHKRYARAHPDRPPLLHLVDTRPLERTRVRLLLEHCPDPHALRALGPDGLRQLFHTHGERCGKATVERILAVLDQSLLPPPSISAVLAAQIQERFALYQTYEAQVASAEAQALALLPHTPGQVLTTVPGVGPILAARYLAGIGDVSRFPSARHIWAFAGFDLNVSDSGNHRSHGTISQRGSPYLRATLYQCGFLAAQHCPDIIRLSQQARERGLDDVRATIHVANKVNRILVALLTTQQPYRSPLTEEQQAHFLALAAARRSRVSRSSAVG
jgi:transposase